MLRTDAEQRATIARLRAAKDAKTINAMTLQDEMTKSGFNKLYYAANPDYLPGLDSILDRPGDIMHIYASGGIASHESG